MDIAIRRIRADDEEQVRAAHAVISAETKAFTFAPRLEHSASFEDWLAGEDARERGEGLVPGAGPVPESRRVAVVGGRIAGAVSIRHLLNPFLLRQGGHVGFGVLPEYRRRGVATALLGHALGLLADQGWDRALVTCDSANHASRRTIQRAGGVLEDVVDTVVDGGPSGRRTERWWIRLDRDRPPRPGAAGLSSSG